MTSLLDLFKSRVRSNLSRIIVHLTQFISNTCLVSGRVGIAHIFLFHVSCWFFGFELDFFGLYQVLAQKSRFVFGS